MDVIWNLTKVCPWDCAMCCMSAIHVCETTKFIVQQRQKDKGLELRINEKLSVLRQLADLNCEIDFSGGDLLYYEEDFQVIDQATCWLPSSKISISMTGSQLTERKFDLLKRVGTVEFTLDNLPEINNPARPQGYHLASLVALRKCVEHNIKVRAVSVLYPSTMRESNLRNIYKFLCDTGVNEWELLRFYPVGRATKRRKSTPSIADYQEAMSLIRDFSGYTKAFFQHSLRMIDGNGFCPAARETIGILPDGQVTACAWGINKKAQPLPEFFLGKLPEQKLSDIIQEARERPEFQEEVGYCRVIALLKEK